MALMVRKQREDYSHVVTIILAGGAGKRLFPLTGDRSKPAVPLGGKYRLIDIPISNSINSGLKRLFVLTQYNSASLNRHIALGYRFDEFSKGFIEVLAAEQTMQNRDWFQGTADAVRQHLHRFTGRNDDYQLVLAGDQLYRMNYQKLVEIHWQRNADVTVCVIPRSEDQASQLGLLKLDHNGRIVQFCEKPTGDALLDMRTDTAAHGLNPRQALQRPYLASMGIYLFRRGVLMDLLSDPSAIDFGHQVIPMAIERYNAYGHLFDGYWEDLGTVGAFYKANIDLTSSAPHFDFYDMSAPVYTHGRFLPPSRIERCTIKDSVIAEGSLLQGASITSSIVGIRSVVGEDVVLDQALVMGADYYEDDEDRAYDWQMGIPNMGIGKGSVVRRAIIDKNAHIGKNARILNEAGVQEYDGNGYYIRDGIVIVPKDGVLHDDTVV
jgi:glucose-1-phosphate adenylyltransferase